MIKYTTDATDGPAPEVLQSLDELAREGARRMIAAALQLEADEYVERLRDARDEKGRALVVRNGRARERKVTVGDGALGFWAALRQVYPKAREQRCWVHKIANVLDKLPQRLQARAKEMLHEAMGAPDRKSAQEGLGRFAEEFEAKYPKAVACLAKDAEVLLTFFDFPAEHWRHLRTTNPIESPFAGVRARTRQTKGAGSRKAGLTMAFKLALAAEGHWRKVNAPHLIVLVRAGVRFRDGVHIITPDAYEQQLDGSREGIAA